MFMFRPTFDIDSIPRRLGYIESQHWGGKGGSILVSGDNKEIVDLAFCQIIDLYDRGGGVEGLKLNTIIKIWLIRLLISRLDFPRLFFYFAPTLSICYNDCQFYRRR